MTAPADSRRLEQILGHTRWRLECVPSLGQVLTRMRELPGAVLISDTVLPDGGWRDLLAHVGREASPAPLIVAAHHADDRLWMEVLNSGGYNVLGKPFEEQEVFRVISMAWLHGRKRERAIAQGR